MSLEAKGPGESITSLSKKRKAADACSRIPFMRLTLVFFQMKSLLAVSELQVAWKTNIPCLVQQPSNPITFGWGSISFSNSNSASKSLLAVSLSFSSQMIWKATQEINKCNRLVKSSGSHCDANAYAFGRVNTSDVRT